MFVSYCDISEPTPAFPSNHPHITSQSSLAHVDSTGVWSSHNKGPVHGPYLAFTSLTGLPRPRVLPPSHQSHPPGRAGPWSPLGILRTVRLLEGTTAGTLARFSTHHISHLNVHAPMKPSFLLHPKQHRRELLLGSTLRLYSFSQ